MVYHMSSTPRRPRKRFSDGNQWSAFEQAVPVSTTPADHLPAPAAELPDLDASPFGAGAPGNPPRVSGAGEAGRTAVGAAVANAAVDALGEGGVSTAAPSVRPGTVFRATRPAGIPG